MYYKTKAFLGLTFCKTFPHPASSALFALRHSHKHCVVSSFTGLHSGVLQSSAILSHIDQIALLQALKIGHMRSNNLSTEIFVDNVLLFSYR